MQDKDKEIVQMEDAIPADVNAILQELPEEKRNAILTTMMAFEEERSFSGPLPPPEYLDAYEKTLPGAPDRILVMAEKQVDHRIDVEKTIVKKKFNQSTLGQIIGAILIFFLRLHRIRLGYARTRHCSDCHRCHYCCQPCSGIRPQQNSIHLSKRKIRRKSIKKIEKAPDFLPSWGLFCVQMLNLCQT